MHLETGWQNAPQQVAMQFGGVVVAVGVAAAGSACGSAAAAGEGVGSAVAKLAALPAPSASAYHAAVLLAWLVWQGQRCPR
jgi:hypothetical protein